MRLIIIGAAIILTGCKTTKVAVTPVNIQPVEQIKSDPFDPHAAMDEAKDDFAEENYRSALENYAQVYAYDPTEIKALFGQAQSHLAMGDYLKAARIFWSENLNKLGEDFADQVAIGKILSGVYTDRYDNPISAINDGMMLSPDDARLWNAKGQYHDRRAEWMDALGAYLEAMKTGDWQAGTVNNMGMSLLLQDRLDEARDKFEQALGLKPDSEVYDSNLRMVHILQGDLKKALSGLSETRAADVLNDAGYVAMKRQKNGLAQGLFKKALEISPVYHAKAQANLDSLEKLETAARLKSAATTP